MPWEHSAGSWSADRSPGGDRSDGCCEQYARTPLTGRPWEIAGLIANGLTNGQIGAELVVAKETGANHVEHILNGLGFRCCAQIAVWVVEQELLDDRSD